MIYRHYKGNLYRVLFTGLYEPTAEEVVIYVSLSNGIVWVRPASVFHGNVEGQNIRRFELTEIAL